MFPYFKNSKIQLIQPLLKNSFQQNLFGAQVLYKAVVRVELNNNIIIFKKLRNAKQVLSNIRHMQNIIQFHIDIMFQSR